MKNGPVDFDRAMACDVSSTIRKNRLEIVFQLKPKFVTRSESSVSAAVRALGERADSVREYPGHDNIDFVAKLAASGIGVEVLIHHLKRDVIGQLVAGGDIDVFKPHARCGKKGFGPAVERVCRG